MTSLSLVLPLPRPCGARGVPLVDCWIGRRIICLSTLSYTATGVVNSGRPSGPVGPPTRTIRIPAPHHHAGALSSGDSREALVWRSVEVVVERDVAAVALVASRSDRIVTAF